MPTFAEAVLWLPVSWMPFLVRAYRVPSTPSTSCAAQGADVTLIADASSSQYCEPSDRVATWYPERQEMSSDDRAPGARGDEGAAVGESAHAASASVAAAASRTRIFMAAPL